MNTLSIFLRTLFQHFCLLLHLFTIATPPPLETLVEVHLPHSSNTSLIITVFKNSSTKVDKSTQTSILFPPPSIPFQDISTTSSSTGHSRHGPIAEVEDIITMTSSQSKVHILKAAIFHTMAYKLSLEINKNKITPKTNIASLKVPYNVAQIKNKKITFEQYSRIHLAGPKIAICETASNAVFVLNSAFTSKDQYFHTAILEAIIVFNNIRKDFGYTQTLEYYNPLVHQAHPPPQHPLFQ